MISSEKMGLGQEAQKFQQEETEMNAVIQHNIAFFERCIPAQITDYNKAAIEFMLKDLEKSGLAQADMGTFIPPPPSAFHLKATCYRIPYFHLDGTQLEIMYRDKLITPKVNPRTGKAQKYDQPSKASAGEFANYPYFHPKRRLNNGKVRDIHEGEKKGALAVKQGQYAIAIGGGDNWRDPNNRDAIHPDILTDCAGAECIRLWPDGDVRTNLNVQMAWATFARALMAALKLSKENVRIMDLSGFGPGAKFDDLVPVYGYEHVMQKVGLINVDELRISGKQLKDAVPLLEVSTVESEDPAAGSKVTVAASESNFAKIFRSYPFFKGQLWFNDDLRQFMYGEEAWDEHGIIVLKMLELFQSVLGFSKKGTKGNFATVSMIENAMKLVAWENQFSPHNAYLTSLVWDKKPRLDNWLSDYCWASPDDAFAKKAGSAFLIAAVGRALDPGCFYRWMLILSGPQGGGKSGVPDALFGPMNTASVSKANAAGKDEQQLLGTTLCANFDELAAIKRQDDIEHMKSLISLRQYRVRLPYAKAFSAMLSRCVLFGSTNHAAQFLAPDESGNNRYVVVEVGLKGKHVVYDFAGLAAVKDQLWAEAVYRYRQGEKFDTVEGADAQAEHYVDTKGQDSVLNAFCSGFADLYKWPKGAANDERLFFKLSMLEAWFACRGERVNLKDLRAGLLKLGFKFDGNGLRPSDGYQATGRIVIIPVKLLQSLTGHTVTLKAWAAADPKTLEAPVTGDVPLLNE